MSRKQKTIEKVILFTKSSDPRTGFLSNESKHSFILDEKRWPTVEHYLQAKKFDGTEYEETIRKAPTVYQARKLAQPYTTLAFDPSGRVSRKKVYGRKDPKKQAEYYIREDWAVVEPVLMEEAIRAKFSQNARLKRRLLDTHNAKLTNPQNPLLGPTLERIRGELSPKSSPTATAASPAPSGWSPKELKDFRSDHLSAKDKKFVEGMVALTLRVAETEGRGKVHAGMVEDAAYSIAPNKKTGEEIVRYIRGINDVSWTDIYSSMPKYERVINEIHEIFTKSDEWQKTQIGPSALIAATLRWLHMEATPAQKEEIYAAASNPSKVDIVLQKQKRWYRRSPEFTPGRRKPKAKAKAKSKSPATTPLTPKEKDTVRAIIEEHRDKLDDITFRQLREILKERLGRSPVMRKRDLKRYVDSVLQEIVTSSPSPDPESPLFPPTPTPTPKAKTPKKTPKPKKKTPSPKAKTPTPPPPERIEKPEDLPDRLTIHDTSDGNFVVWGKPLPRYASKLLVLGGKYPRKLIGGEMIEDRNVMQFRGKILEENIEELKSLGGRHPISGKGKVLGHKVKRQKRNTKILQFQGASLEENRARLEEIGGKYPRKRTGAKWVNDTNRIRFSGLYRDRVEEVIFGSLSTTEKYIAAYQKWVEDKLLDFIDTAIQVAYLKDTTEIDEKMIEMVVLQIYGCEIIEPGSKETLEFDYTDIIHTVLSSRDAYTDYSLTKAAKTLLSRYVESLGRTLTAGVANNTYEEFQSHLKEVNDWADRMGTCPKIGDFTSQEVCILRALRHIAACFKNLLGYPVGVELATRAFLTLLPPRGWRMGAEQYISSVLSSREWKYEDWMAEDEIERQLQAHDVNYPLSEIYKVIKHYDREATSTDSVSGVLGDDCEACAIVFAVAVHYLSPGLHRPGYEHVISRIKVLGFTPEPKVEIREKPTKPPPAEILLDEPDPGEIVEVDSSLTEFEYSDWVVVVANSTSQSLVSKPTLSERITDQVFRAYPYADIYTQRPPTEAYNLGSVILTRPQSGTSRTPLASTSDHRYVACLIAEFNEGGPKKILDTVENRRKWFEGAVTELFKSPQIKKAKSIAFSTVQLTPDEYTEILEDVAISAGYPGTIYILSEASRQKPRASPKSKAARPQRKASGGTPPSQFAASPEPVLSPDMTLAVRYLKVLRPAKLPSETYSEAVENLQTLEKSERDALLKEWEALSPTRRRKAVEEWLE